MSPQDAGNRNASAPDVRERAAFEAWQMAWAPKGDECERARIEWDKLDTHTNDWPEKVDYVCDTLMKT